MIKGSNKIADKHPLSAEWAHSHRMIENRMSFFGKGITVIDKLDEVEQEILLQIKQLDLSHNALIKIQNIKQFPNLSVINLAHNHIADGKNILKLSKLTKLKTVQVKGNPFLKSGQGKIFALRLLVNMNTDIDILGNRIDNLLTQCIENYSRKQIKKQYNNKLSMEVEVVNDYNYQVVDKCLNLIGLRLVNKLIQDRINEIICDNLRRQVVFCILRQKQQQQLDSLQTQEHLQQYFEECLNCYSEKLEKEMVELDNKINSKIQILDHVKTMRRQKQNRDCYSSVTKKQSTLVPTSSFPKYHSKSPMKKNGNSPQKNINQFAISIKKPSQFVSAQSKKFSQQNFQSYYYNMLTIHNPVYQLLFSPLHSLKSKEKDLLIETMSNHLKQKSYIIFKNEGLKQELASVKKKCEQEQKNALERDHQLEEYQTLTNQKLDMLELIANERQEQIKQLNQKLELTAKYNQQLANRIEYLEEELGESKLKDIQLTHQLQKVRREQEIIEDIQAIREKHIKKKMMKVIQHRAKILAKLTVTKKKQQSKVNNRVMKFCFQFIKKEVENRKKIVEVKDLILGRCLKQFQRAIQLQIKISKTEKIREKNVKGLFFKALTQKNLRVNKNNIIIANKKKVMDRKILLMYFNGWKQQYQMRKQISSTEKLKQFYLNNLKKRIFENWTFFLKLPMVKQKQLQLDLRQIKMKEVLCLLLCNNYMKVLERQKTMNLVDYLDKQKRCNFYYNFKSSLTNELKLRSRKQNKVKNNLLQKYFYEFLQIAGKLKREGKKFLEKVNKVINVRRKVLIHLLNSQDYAKKIKKGKLVKIIQKYRKVYMNQQIKLRYKQLIIQDKIKKSGMKLCFLRLQTHLNQKIRMLSKRNELKLKLKQRQQRFYFDLKSKTQFLHMLMKPKTESARLDKLLTKKQKRLMMKCIMEWRISTYKERIQYLKVKISQFGPQIQQITRRQKATFDEKLVLMKIIESKEKTIKDFIQQLEEAEYAIKSKEEKYQKLKDYFYENREEESLIDNKIQSSSCLRDHRIPQRDYDIFVSDNKEYFSNFRRF